MLIKNTSWGMTNLESGQFLQRKCLLDISQFKMPVHIAGILVYRYQNNDLQVLLVYLGGSFWSGKDLVSWSIPKGFLMTTKILLMQRKKSLGKKLDLLFKEILWSFGN